MFRKYKAIILAAFLVILFGILPNNFMATVKAADSKAWINVGTPGLLSGIYPKLFIADGTPYVVVLSGNKIAVMKYNGSTWEKLGNIPTVGNDMGMSLYVYNGIPYVSFCDCGGGSEIKVSVMKYNNGNWESIGTPNFSSQYVNETSICVYGGVPYVTFIDNRQNITLEKYDGGKWQTVGNAQFAKASSNSTLAIYNGIPYVAFRSGYDGTGKLMKFDKGSWQTVGNSPILPAPAYPSFLSLAIDSDGTPYVSFTNESTNVLTVKKFNNGSWVTIGNAGSLGSNTEYSSISVYNGTPYVAFNDNRNGGSTVIKYNGTDWETVGSAGLSVNNIFTTALSVYNGTPYVAFCTTKSNLTVMKYTTVDPPPTASPASGTVSSGTLVTLSSSISGADIYYTLDGTNPSATSTRYTSGIAINAPVTIRAISVRNGITSTVMSAAYKVNSSITPTSASFDKYSGSSYYADINAAMTLNGNTLSSIKNGATVLTAGRDYVLSGSNVAIKKEYLKGLANGTVNLTFSFNVGNTQSLNLTIKDTTPANSSITATSSSFDKYSGSSYYADINVTMTLNGNTLSSIKNGTTPLTAETDYVVSGSNVTIKKDYLKGLANGTVNLTFSFNAGNTQSLNLTVKDTTPANSSITATSSSFDKYSGSLYYADINVNMTLNGNTLSNIKNGTTFLSSGRDYAVSGSSVTIKKDYLKGLANGTVNLTFCFNAGNTQSLNIAVSDSTPASSSITPTSSSFDKYLGSLNYTDINVDMTLNGNTLASIKNGTAPLSEGADYVTTGSFVTIKKEYLEGLATGIVNLTFYFNAGANQSLNIDVSDTAPGNSSITPTSSSFDKYSSSSYYADVNVDMTLNGNTLSDIKNGTTSLSAVTDYAVSGNTVTIKKEYLEKLATGTVNLTFCFNAGANQSLNITVSDTTPDNSSITPTSSSFDKYSGSSYYTDINVDMTLNGNTLSDIKNGTTSLIAGTDYVATGSAVTIKKEYLERLATGTVNLTFCFNAGTNQPLNINISDTTPGNSSITTTSSSFDKYSGSSNYGDMNVTMTLNGNTLSDIKNEGTSLTADTDYVVSGSTVTIKKEYLEGLATGTVNLTFCFNAGANQSLNITVSDTNPDNSSITPTSSGFDKYLNSSDYADINVDMTLNGNTLLGLKNGTTSLSSGTDYVVAGSTVTIKKEYLEGLATGTVNLTFCFNAGANQSLNITVSDTNPGNSSITPIISSFDKYSGSSHYADINVDMTLNGNTLSDIKNGDNSLTAGTDYVVSGSTVAIRKEYLKGLDTGTVILTFDFSSGDSQILLVTIGDSTAVAPTITTGPAAQAVTEGQNVSFSVTAAGTDPLNYQWKKDGADISGANSSTLSLNNVQLSNAGSYSVAVSNNAGSVTSSAVTLTVLHYVTPTPTPEVVTIPVTDGSSGDTVSQTTIERTTNADGSKHDGVQYTEDKAKQTVDVLKQQGKDTARVVIPDTKDEVSETKVDVPKATTSVLAGGNINLEIDTENARITLPQEAVKQVVDEDLYFRLVPIKQPQQQQEVKQRAQQEDIVRNAAGNSEISIVGRPMTIETNMKQTKTFITLPLKDVAMPSDPVQREAFLNSLAVFIEHSDATKELLKGEVVDYKTGVLGLRFPITKYSTFTIIKMDIQNSTISPVQAEFDKNASKQADLSTTLTLNGNNLVSIKNGDKTLVSGTDYAATSEGVTIKKEYLAQQSTGTVNLTFNFSAGISQSLTIAVKDTTSQNSVINPTTAGFDKNTAKQADVSTSLELKGNTLLSIANGTKALVNGTDYVITNGTVNIKKEYLAAQSIGTTTLTFTFSAGNAQALVITVKDTTPSSSGGSGGSGGGTPAPSPVPEKTTIERIYGQDRISTAIAIAKSTYKDKVSKVILAASDNYPDALAGSVLAYKEKAPILLVGKNAEEQEKVIAYMKENMNSTGSVYILGGIGSVSKDIENKVVTAGFSNISRIGGEDRYETASKIADTVGIKEGTPVIIVSGDNYPDAISVSSIAAVKQYPIFMVNKDEIPEVVKKEISSIKPGKIYIIGLQGAISKAVEDNLSQSIDKANIVRIGGSDRFETSLNVAKYFNLSGTKACVASGKDFPDALAGSNYAANSNSPIILVDNSLTEEQKTYLKDDKIKEITIFGGTGAVTNEVENVINELIKK